jgi:formate dehydrogenase alpha subunit
MADLVPLTEEKFVDLSIDGETVTVPEGTSIYDAVIGMGKTIPSMCYHYTFSPFGSCGVCLVEVEGKKAPVRSCTSPVAAGMIVRVDTKTMFDARKKAVEKHLQTHPLDCPVCDADGHCELQDMSFNFGITQIGEVKQKGLPEDRRSVVLDFNMNRCILCAQCINICKEVVMVDALQFFKKGGFTHVVAKGDNALECEFCGDCLAVCPVGAITNKFSKYLYKPWQLTKTLTTCNYCADGCQMRVEVETKEQKVVRVTSPLSWKDKWDAHEATADGHGGLCVRGRFGFAYINSPERLKKPLMRRQGALAEVSWFEATAAVAQGLKRIKAEHGPDAIAGLITARCTNEDLYVFQKFMRRVIGTNQLDSSARYGQASYAAAMDRALGAPQPTVTFQDLTLAQAILVIGSDVTETNPVLALRIKEALRNHGSQVIVAHPVTTHLAELAAYHCRIRPGSEGAFVQGLVKAVVEESLVPEAVKNEHPGAFAAVCAAVAPLSWEVITAATGIGRDAMAEIARVFAGAARRVIVIGEQITGRVHGYENTLRVFDLLWATGSVGQPGSGVIRLCEENNERGAVAVGALADRLPGGVGADDDAVRARLAAAWGAALPTGGATLTDIIAGIQAGRIKALYAVGENPLGTLPANAGVREAFAKLELLVAQDPFLTETGAMAHVVLPTAVASEKDGTFLDGVGILQPVVRAVDPLDDTSPDWAILCEVAQLMGVPMEYADTEHIRREILQVAPDAFARPVPSPERVAAYLRENFAWEVRRRYAEPAVAAEPATETYPFELSLFQSLYHSGKLSTRDAGLLKIDAKALLQMNPDEARSLGLAAGDRARVSSALGVVEVGVETVAMVPRGVCRFPEHFNDPPMKDLLPLRLDPVSKAPTFKAGRVKIEKVGA